MKTVEIVKTANGTYVTRRYCGQNKGREFFYSVAPASVKKGKRDFVKAQTEAKDKYISEWVGD